MEERDRKERAPEEELADDIDFEPEDELGSVGAMKAKMQKLRAELEKAKAERQEYLDGWQRCKADAANAKKDAAEQAARSGARARDNILEEFFPVLDSFDMAIGSPAWGEIGAEWTSGIERIRSQMLDVLARHGVQRFGKIGDSYDPYVHDAIQEVDDAAGEPGSIVRILRYGYRTAEHVLRPAQVIIKAG